MNPLLSQALWIQTLDGFHKHQERPWSNKEEVPVRKATVLSTPCLWCLCMSSGRQLSVWLHLMTCAASNMSVHHMGHRVRSKLNTAPALGADSFFEETPQAVETVKSLIQVGKKSQIPTTGKTENQLHMFKQPLKAMGWCPDLAGCL